MTSETTVLSYKNATGPIPYGLKNDYMFHMVFQENMEALKGLVASVLHIPVESITDIQVLNPIELGESIEDKTFILDLKIIINNSTVINLELQIDNEHNHPERTLGYLCRIYDNLNKGEDYIKTMPAIHISFLNFTLFQDSPEFCAKYMVMNVKNHRLYTSKFSLIVVELNNTELATEEDLMYGIDKWARLFNSRNWEDLKMCAGDNKAMQEALKELYKYNTEEQIREQCEARERYYARKRYMENQLMDKDNIIVAKDAEIAAKDKEIAAKDEEIAAKDEEIALLREQLAKESYMFP